MGELKKRRLGRTNLMVTELGLGSYHITGEKGVPRDEAHRIFDLAFQEGINFVDSAPMYGFGEAEELVGRALKRTDRNDILVSTKVGWLDRTVVRHLGDDAYRDEASIRRVVEHSLWLLGRSRVEVMMIHEPEWPQWALDPKQGGIVLDTLEKLKREGVIGAIGMGGIDCDFMASMIETDRIDVVLNFMHYDLAVQDATHRLLPAARKHDVGVILGGPFRQGALAEKQHERIAEMRRTNVYPWGFDEEVLRRIDGIYALADEWEMSLSEMGIRFLLSDPQISTIIPGPRKVAELKSNIEAALKGPLPQDMVERIKAL